MQAVGSALPARPHAVCSQATPTAEARQEVLQYRKVDTDNVGVGVPQRDLKKRSCQAHTSLNH